MPMMATMPSGGGLAGLAVTATAMRRSTDRARPARRPPDREASPDHQCRNQAAASWRGCHYRRAAGRRMTTSRTVGDAKLTGGSASDHERQVLAYLSAIT